MRSVWNFLASHSASFFCLNCAAHPSDLREEEISAIAPMWRASRPIVPDVHVLQCDVALLELGLVELDGVVRAMLPKGLVVVPIGAHITPAEMR